MGKGRGNDTMTASLSDAACAKGAGAWASVGATGVPIGRARRVRRALRVDPNGKERLGAMFDLVAEHAGFIRAPDGFDWAFRIE